MDFPSLRYALENYCCVHKRSKASQPWSFIVGDLIYRGPYKKGEKRFEHIMGRSKIFELWNTPCVLKAMDYIETSDGIFIRFPNIWGNNACVYVKEEFSDISYSVLKTSALTSLRTAVSRSPLIFNYVEDLLLALCHCNILGVSEMNLHHCLINLETKTMYIVDFDGRLSIDKDNEIFYFNKPPSKDFGWYERVKGFYQNVAERLLPLLEDKLVISLNLKSRVERAIYLLKNNAGSVHKPMLVKEISDPSPPVNLEPQAKGPMGKMAWKGLRGEGTKTYSGYDFDIMISALQKYIRRNMTEKAILVAVEIFRLSEVGGDPAVTNLFNRLAIIANEDIGPANPALSLEVTRLVEAKIRDITTLVVIVQLLAESPKSRINSHAWHAYATPEGRLSAYEKGLELDTNFSKEDIKFISQHQNCDLFVESDPSNIRPFILMFWKRLQEKSFNAFSWVYFFLTEAKSLNIYKRRKYLLSRSRSLTGKADILLWKVLEKFLDPEIIDIFVEAYFNHLDGRPFLQNAIMLTLSGLTTYEKFDIFPAVDLWKESPALNQMMMGEFSLHIPQEEMNFIVDVHTSRGKRLGKNIQDFVKEGTKIIPQNEEFLDPFLESIYQAQ